MRDNAELDPMHVMVMTYVLRRPIVIFGSRTIPGGSPCLPLCPCPCHSLVVMDLYFVLPCVLVSLTMSGFPATHRRQR